MVVGLIVFVLGKSALRGAGEAVADLSRQKEMHDLCRRGWRLCW